jgi:hypothetical protein
MRRRNFLALPAALIAQSDGAGWRPLFDGKSLDGWSVQEGPESAFYVHDGAIAGSPSSEFPAWLRSDAQYENFELELEWFPRGWSDGGVYFCAPEHGSRSRAGFKLSLFQQVDQDPRSNSMGSLYPVVAPRKVNVRPNAWNQVRIRLDWPRFEAWSNGEPIHDLNLETHRALRYRLRSGFLGVETLSYPLRFRNLRVRELPSKQKWQVLYQSPSDLQLWTVTESNQRSPAQFQTLGNVLRADGLGNLTTKERYRDFELQMYVRGSWHHNGGVLFRSVGGRERYEIQLHDVEEAHYPTGSL